jgi:hypothetical protein
MLSWDNKVTSYRENCMEHELMTAQASAQTNTYSNLPLANLYTEAVDFWKKNYDDFRERKGIANHVWWGQRFRPRKGAKNRPIGKRRVHL